MKVSKEEELARQSEQILMVNLQPSDRQSRLTVTMNPRQEARNPNLCFKEHF